MPEQWNKYAPTAARRHGRPGRELRPKTVTVDIHSHVAVPAAAKFVEPYLDWDTNRLRISPMLKLGRSVRNRKPIFVPEPGTTTDWRTSMPWASMFS